MLGYSYVSSAGALFLLVAAITFVPTKISRKRRAVIGILHVSAHLASALILMLLLELGVETCIRHKLLATKGEFAFLLIFINMRWFMHLCHIIFFIITLLFFSLSLSKPSYVFANQNIFEVFGTD